MILGLQHLHHSAALAPETNAAGMAQVRALQPQGVASWWQPGHPGWAIYPVDSDHFMSTGALDSLSVQNDSVAATPQPGSPGIALDDGMIRSDKFRAPLHARPKLLTDFR